MFPAGHGHDAVLYTRAPAAPGTVEIVWELLGGRPRTLREKAAELGIQTAALAEVEQALAGCAPGRSRVLRGIDQRVDLSVMRWNPEEGAARDRELAGVISDLS